MFGICPSAVLLEASLLAASLPEVHILFTSFFMKQFLCLLFPHVWPTSLVPIILLSVDEEDVIYNCSNFKIINMMHYLISCCSTCILCRVVNIRHHFTL
jgi:hypothetical protein